MKRNDTGISVNGQPSPENLPVESLREGDHQNKDYFNEIVFKDWANSIEKDIDEDNKQEELQRIRKWVKNDRFYRGQQRGFFSPVTGTYQPINLDDYQATEQSILLINNQVRPLVKAIAKEWAKSQSKLHAISTKDDNKTKRASRYVDAALVLFQRKLIDEPFKQREAQNAILFGNYFRYNYWSEEGNAQSTIERPVFEEKTFTIGDEHYQCLNCKIVGDITELNNNNCPDCDGDVEINKPIEKTMREQTGTETINIGQPVSENIHPIEVKVHLRARNIRQSPYLRRKRPIMSQILKYAFPYAKICGGKDMSPVSRYATELESSSGNTNSGSGTPDGAGANETSKTTELVEFVQIWLDKPMYFNVKLSESVTLGDGTVIPKGTKLIDLFPDGLYMAKNGNEVLDIKNESKNDFWNHGAYDILSSSFWGDGIEDVIQNQQFINEVQSLMVENILHNASPKIIFNPSLIDHELLTGRPREMTPMSVAARKDDKPQNAIMQLSGMSLTGEAQGAMAQGKDDMRQQLGAFPTMQGMSDPHIQTATGMAIVRDSALGLISPALALKAQVEVEWAYQILKLIKGHWVEEAENLSGILGKYSVPEAQAFSECDLDRDIEIIAEPSSWMPRTDIEVRQDFINFLTVGGLPMGFLNPAFPQEVKQRASELFRFDISFDKIEPDIRWANLRLEQLEEIVIKLVQRGFAQGTESDEQTVAQICKEIPIDLYIDTHSVYIDEYTKFLKTDKGIYSMPLLKASVKYLIMQHEEAGKTLKQEMLQSQQEEVANQALTEGAIQRVNEAGDEEEIPDDSPVMSEEEMPQEEPVDIGVGREVGGDERPTSSNAKTTPVEFRK